MHTNFFISPKWFNSLDTNSNPHTFNANIINITLDSIYLVFKVLCFPSLMALLIILKEIWRNRDSFLISGQSCKYLNGLYLLIWINFSRPIGMALVCNLAMFVFASRILNQLENKKKFLTKTTTARSVSHEPSARKFSRQLSTIQKSVSTKVKSQKANTDL